MMPEQAAWMTPWTWIQWRMKGGRMESAPSPWWGRYGNLTQEPAPWQAIPRLLQFVSRGPGSDSLGSKLGSECVSLGNVFNLSALIVFLSNTGIIIVLISVAAVG